MLPVVDDCFILIIANIYNIKCCDLSSIIISGEYSGFSNQKESFIASHNEKNKQIGKFVERKAERRYEF